MFHPILIFLVTSLISFMGSVQLGPVNLVIIREVLDGNWRGAFLNAFGICIPEFVYSFFALFAARWFLVHPTLLQILEWSIVPLLFGLGIYNLRKKPGTGGPDIKAKGSDFMQGFLISALNPQMLPFWLTILVMLSGYDFFTITTAYEKLAFVLGTGFGEFVVISLIIWLTHRHREYLLSKMRKWNLNKVFGGLFFLLAIFQSVKLLIHPGK
ncbi:MAG TPA: LysE family transporter [Bacteroidia bacterium]|nr:LysE family transporter [Bacteroidia bacterium]